MQTQNTLPEYSRVWVYQSDRIFSPDEKKHIETKTAAFVTEWAAHGSKLSAAIELFYDRFIVIFVDEAVAAASGCSIDKSFRLIQELEKELNLSLLDRMQIAYKEEQTVKTLRLPDFEKAIADKKITEHTIVFNNLVGTKKEFLQNWETPLRNSWHARFLEAVS